MTQNLPEKILRQFQNGLNHLPDFKNEEEEKIFLQLQKYNLLYVTAGGRFKITKRGQEALKGNVEKHLSLERFEERLIKDSFKKSSEQKILLFVILPVIILLVILLLLSNFLNWKIS
ncbi:MAG: hypothetical protein ACQEWD_05845 [Bacteroidota bacterium]